MTMKPQFSSELIGMGRDSGRCTACAVMKQEWLSSNQALSVDLQRLALDVLGY